MSAVWHRPHTCFRTKKGPNSTDLFHLFYLEANMIPSGFSFLINLGHFGGALQRSWRPLRIAQRFWKVWLNAHFASYRLFNPGSHGRFHFCSHTRSFLSTKRRSVAIYLVCIGFVVLIYFAGIFSKHCVSNVINVLRMCSSLISELKEPLLLRWVGVFVLK